MLRRQLVWLNNSIVQCELMGHIVCGNVNELDLRRSGYLCTANDTSSHSAHGKSDSGK